MRISPEQGFWGRAATIGAPIVCAAALFAPTADGAETQPKALELATALVEAQPQGLGPVQKTLEECGKLEDHVFEACAAYIFNDAHWALQPYYKYVKSDSYLSGLKNRFKERYLPTARQKINRMAKVASWPRGTNKINGPNIDIIDAEALLECGKAVLVTREDWQVKNDTRTRPLYEEVNRVHTVVLERLPDERFRLGDLVLHAWRVSNIFNGRSNIKPNC
ncbi:MAG: hypothetical protein UX30_C0007G0100 [Candidatus Saccharibacteria bacterium GW2011_GWA2_46_10]|nr:MAG: hypothetical protein UX30_C0007G0100 [Candidatus Saccharibacteria bacterium GW2011_GWA2_46_10]OGL35851.1 MAG: hypothetical protein A3F05_00725 [Candidatus Saccharibacteria bacterium RIFCSPHIGHO2_12_FULL_47_17]